MIVEEHVQAFINSLNKEENAFILRLQKEAHEHHVPIIREEMRELLRFLVRLQQPERILEIGTAIGYSAIVMHHCQPDNGRIVTIERNDKRYEQAILNIAEAGYESEIMVYHGDALDILPQLEGQFDFIFTDAAKGQYMNFLEPSIRLLKTGGMLVCDNVLQEGRVAQSRYAITRRDHTIHGRMREFLYYLKQNETLETVVLPVGDGVALAHKIKERGKEDDQKKTGIISSCK